MISRNLKLAINFTDNRWHNYGAYVVLVAIPTQMVPSAVMKLLKHWAKILRKLFSLYLKSLWNTRLFSTNKRRYSSLPFSHKTLGTPTRGQTRGWDSTKQIFITGSFEAKAGFDLRKKFSIELTDDKAYVTLPEPTLLSIESKGDITYRDENGYLELG
jgi:hypothetical protein